MTVLGDGICFWHRVTFDQKTHVSEKQIFATKFMYHKKKLTTEKVS